LRYLTKTVNRFIDDDCTSLAAALAYYTTFSIAPLLLIVISIVGVIFGMKAVQADIQAQVLGLVGPDAAKQIAAMVESAGKHSSAGPLNAALGILALLFGATGAFVQLQSSLNTVWRVKPDPHHGGIRNFIGQRILSFGMILAIAFLLLVSLVITAAMSAFGDLVAFYLPKWISEMFLIVAGFVVSFAIITALFAAMYKFLPDAVIRWRDVWFGAAITAFLFTIGKFLIGAYLGSSGVASAYGTAGSMVLTVLWIYYSAIVFLIGAEFTEVWSESHSGAVVPKPGAVRVSFCETIHPRRAA
jgi:membrane protein